MDVCIYGAGAVGGLIGFRLGKAGTRISAVARGATLDALAAHGIRIAGGTSGNAGPDAVTDAVQVRAVADAAALGVQDLVVVAVKAPAMEAVARGIGPLVGPDTVVMTAMNGIPWWFFQGFGGPLEGRSLASVDPDGTIAAAIPGRSVVGSVVHFSASTAAPGIVVPGPGSRIIVGEPGGGSSERSRRVVSLLARAGFEAVESPSIQKDIWFKLWGNMTMNPITALTGATCDRVLDDPLLNRFCLAIMAEAAAIGSRIGCAIDQTGEERNVLTRALGAVKTSMQRDVEAGRAIELDAIVGAVREIGSLVGLATPNTDTLYGLVRMFARERGLYPAAGER